MASTERDLEARIGHAFAQPSLLRQALTHPSVSGGRGGKRTYERLEFLGDRVLGLVMAEQLLALFPEEEEGKLALRFNALVRAEACARAARRIDVGSALIVSATEAKGGGRDNDTILADACEALIAAVYLDGGLEAARDLVRLAWAEEFAPSGVAPQDPKTALQEWAARRKRPNPRYDIVERSGPDHAPRFVVEAEVEGMAPARGEGGSKRDAERAAARALLKAAGVDV
jgi:ribonuclease-3